MLTCVSQVAAIVCVPIIMNEYDCKGFFVWFRDHTQYVVRAIVSESDGKTLMTSFYKWNRTLVWPVGMRFFVSADTETI